MLALLAAAVLAPLLYLPGYLVALALLGREQPADALERHYERVVAGALLNGWLALTLAELGVFSAWLHLLLLLVFCAGFALLARRRGALRLPQAPVGIVAPHGSNVQTFKRSNVRTLARHWDALGFVAIGLLFALLVARPFEVVLGARDAGVYANAGFAIARTGGIVQRDDLVRQIGLDKQSPDQEIAAAAAQAETNLLGNQSASRFIATRLRFSGFLINNGALDDGQVIPQGLHLYPAWIGLLASLIGLRGGLLATGVLGLLGLWGVGMLGRRLAGRWVGLLGALFLALNGVQVWFSRYSTSEAAAQFLSFAALYAFAVMNGPSTVLRAGGRPTTDDRRRTTDDGRAASSLQPPASSLQPPASSLQSPVSGLQSPVSGLPSRQWFGGLIAGLAAGQLALTRIDFILLVGPLLLYLAYVALTRRWRPAHWALAGGLGAMLLQALLQIVFIARAYFLDTLYARLQDQSAIVAYLAYLLWTPALRRQFMEIPRSAPLRSPLRLPIELALVAALVVAFVLLRRDGRPQQWIERVVARYRRGLLSLGAAAVLLLGAYGYLIRPQILTAETLAAAPGCLAPAQIRQPSGACLALQGYIGAPIESPAHPNAIAYLLYAAPKWIRGQAVPPRQAVSISPDRPAEADKIAIAQANLVRVGWYLSPLGVILGILGFALWWRCGLNRASWPFLLGSLLSAFFFVRLAYGSSDLTYIYILRRYMPLVYPALSLGMAYALVALATMTKDQGPRTKDQGRTAQTRLRRLWSIVFGPSSLVFRLSSIVCALALLAFLAATGWPLYRHVEYAGALDQLATVAGGFEPQDVLLFRGEGRDTPDLMVTPLKYAFDRNAFAIRSADPGKYAAELARYVRRWQSQGRQVYLVLGPNGAVELPGMRPVRVGPASLRLPEYQQLRDQKPRGTQEFVFDFSVYRLDPADGAAPAAALPIGVDDYTAQLRGFYHPEQIGGRPIAWTDGDALLRLPWPKGDAPQALTVSLSPGASRPASLGPARVCLSYRPEASFAFDDRPFSGEQCFELRGPDMAGYRFAIDPRGRPAPPTGTLLLRIASDRWVPAEHDKAQHDERSLGVQFGGIAVSSQQ